MVSHLRTLRLKIPEPAEKYGALELRFMMESSSLSGLLYIANMYSILALDLSKLVLIGSNGSDSAGGGGAATAHAPAQAASAAGTTTDTEQLVQKTLLLLGPKAKVLNCVHCGAWNIKKSSYCGACK
jgi:hypothetical protein